SWSPTSEVPNEKSKSRLRPRQQFATAPWAANLPSTRGKRRCDQHLALNAAFPPSAAVTLNSIFKPCRIASRKSEQKHSAELHTAYLRAFHTLSMEAEDA